MMSWTLSINNPIPERSPNQMITYWRSMGLFNIYRLLIALLLIVAYQVISEAFWLDNYDRKLFFEFAYGYLFVSFITIGLTTIKWPDFNLQLSLHVMTDILFIVVLMFASGGIKSGLGLLLIVAIAAASLISQGRLALFYASIATIALLLEQSYQMISWTEHYDDYSHAVMLSLSCFATAWLAHSLAKRANLSEALASQRGIDLENLAQINKLITQEIEDGILVVDQGFKIRHRNQHAKELLGINADTWLADSLEDCAPELNQRLRLWMEKEDITDPDAMKISTAGRELKLRFMPVGDDRHEGAVIFIQDWSQIEVQAQQLKLAALGRLTANIAHEIRNPLSAISHANQLMQEEEQQDPATKRLLEIIADNVRRLDHIVSDVLELNRRDRTRQETIQLDDFLQEFHDQFCQIEKIAPDYFKLEMNGISTSILFDRRHLHQILWNLCRNGWRHSSQTKSCLSLTLNKKRYTKNMRLEIIDDGPGVSKEAIAHLFEPFFTTETTGTGLGLYIARELCEANAASIQYQPSSPGSLFSIELKNDH
ncbi:sensor histidine kinase [Methyloradius palustris]|uniref:histidine kinase n=1 Tax=Methyloradius palustris TaxID=2778876 RepID=A0A8D5G608_9PROT|nr:ATP-binding protein [Methyloradius palustris]BCM23946.1 PAS domain-containing sensor histidine kinase [Methyloradius palustris]